MNGRRLTIALAALAAIPLCFAVYVGCYFVGSSHYDRPAYRHREFTYEWQCRMFHPLTGIEQATCGLDVVISYRVDPKTQQIYRPGPK